MMGERHGRREEKLIDLVTAMIEGPFQTPQWSRFLELLRKGTGAEHVIFILHPPGRAMDAGVQLVASAGDHSDIAAAFSTCLYPLDAGRPDRFEEAAVTTLEDLRQRRGGAAFAELATRYGVAASRQMYVAEPIGVEAWLAIAKSSGDFGDDDAALLAVLANPLRGVLRSHVATESGRFRQKMADEAVRRLQCGWLLLDQGSHVLAADSIGEAILDGSRIVARNASGRLVVREPKIEREILKTIAQLAIDPAARPRAISLRSDPWLDMLLVPERKQLLSDTAVPAVIAYIHGDNWRSADRCEQLSDLFDLSPSEARLALAMCRGKSIADAAAELGLQVETARSYSKSIYAKTGTRGMADLVRTIMGSILTLAPDA